MAKPNPFAKGGKPGKTPKDGKKAEMKNGKMKKGAQKGTMKSGKC